MCRKKKYSILVRLLFGSCLVFGGASAALGEFTQVYPWPIVTKQSVYAANGMVSSAHPIASMIGVDILKKGGNAFDAGVAVALALNTVEPWMCSPAGSSFYLIYDAKNKEFMALDADNLAPYAATPDKFTRDTLREGCTAMGIPGNLAGYFAVLEKYGTMSFAQLLEPVLYYLERGFVLSPIGERFYQRMQHAIALFPNWARVYAPTGKLPKTGAIIKNPDLARTYRRLAIYGRDEFYKGDIAREMVAYNQANGGLWTMKDLADYEVQWKKPIHTTYKGFDIYGCPPPSSAMTWMEALKTIEAYDLKQMGHNSTEYMHHIVEAFKLAHADGYQWATDPDFVEIPINELLSDNYAIAQRKRIDPNQAAKGRVHYGKPKEWATNPDLAARNMPPPLPPLPVSVAQSVRHSIYNGCTTHVCVVDKLGNALTYTHTIGTIFGGHDVLGKTGVLGSNSMDWFDLDTNIWSGEKSNLIVEPRKRNRFTLCPGIVAKDGKPYILIGGSTAETTMPGVFQVLLNMLEFGMDPQQAITAPRKFYGDILHYTGGTRLHLEPEIRDSLKSDLEAKGHEIVPADENFRMTTGCIQTIMIDPDTGNFAGGAEIRLDGHVAGF
ncbi:MAG: gamma-glutamyltransferase [Desulfobacterales bacterium]|nr:MAG: gamma-glutamyltransferase [Desulfobacterales bacterium]